VSTSGESASPQASSQEQAVLESKQLAMYDIILTISQAHHANCQTTEDKVKALANKPTSLVSASFERLVSCGFAFLSPPDKPAGIRGTSFHCRNC
jgi:hypothetical protein